jgi:peptidoglycan/LPS O-acetylase OafA/YrhL
VRGVAALFVVLHHCWLFSYPGFPSDNGPPWLGFLLHGHLAVVVFIVLSGFSLAVAPARDGWRLGGVRRFLRRRAWRILPAYWAALLFSLLVAWLVVTEHTGVVPTGRSVVVYGLLVQDMTPAPSPNSAFWSIAVEAQLYLVFPLLLLVRRRVGAMPLILGVTGIVVAINLLSGTVRPFASLMHLTPEFAVLFTVGVLAAGVLAPTAGTWVSRAPWSWVALAGALGMGALIVVSGPEWTVGHYFWIDLLLGIPTGALLAALALGRPRRVVRFLDSRPLRSLGSFSYSLYLVHVPIVAIVSRVLVGPRLPAGTPAFLVTAAITVPAALLFAKGFAAVFEIPFQKHRSAAAMLAVLRPHRGGRGTAAPSE